MEETSKVCKVFMTKRWSIYYDVLSTLD